MRPFAAAWAGAAEALFWAAVVGAVWVGILRAEPVVCACWLLEADCDEEDEEEDEEEAEAFPVGQIIGLPGWTPPPSA